MGRWSCVWIRRKEHLHDRGGRWRGCQKHRRDRRRREEGLSLLHHLLSELTRTKTRVDGGVAACGATRPLAATPREISSWKIGLAEEAGCRSQQRKRRHY